MSSGLFLLVAVELTSSFDYRYLLPSLPLIGAGGALGAFILWRRLRPQPAEMVVTVPARDLTVSAAPTKPDTDPELTPL